MRKPAEVEAEAQKLIEMKPRVRQQTAFGDDNHAAIEAQIDVLQRLVSEDAIYEMYPDDEADAHTRDAAMQAYEWKMGREEEAPSDSWAPLARK